MFVCFFGTSVTLKGCATLAGFATCSTGENSGHGQKTWVSHSSHANWASQPPLSAKFICSFIKRTCLFPKPLRCLKSYSWSWALPAQPLPLLLLPSSHSWWPYSAEVHPHWFLTEWHSQRKGVFSWGGLMRCQPNYIKTTTINTMVFLGSLFVVNKE